MFPFLCSGGGTVAKVIGVHGANSATATTVTTPARATTTGSTIVVAVTWTTTTFTSITDSVGLGAPTQILTEEASGGEITRMYYYQNITGNAAHTFTLTIGASQLCNIAIVEILNASTTAALDQSDRRRDAASPFTLAAGLTTTVADEALITFIAGDSGSNPATMAETGLGSSTIQESNTNGATQVAWGLATQIVTATGTYNPSWTQTGATNATVWLVTIK